MISSILPALVISLVSLALGRLNRLPPVTNSDRSYECRQVRERDITIDGDLNDRAWTIAAAMQNFVIAGPHPEPARYATTAWLAWSKKYLYLAFHCEIDDIRSTLMERDSAVFNSEAAELFLLPGGAARPYYEINFNPQNAIYDSLIYNHHYEHLSKNWEKWARAFNANIRSATKVQRDDGGRVRGWSLEAAIPFGDLNGAQGLRPRPGNIWLFNVFRVAHGPQNKMEYSAWEPTYADFHQPAKFPHLIFAK